jgi:O-antigen/teichoic acid export membrane protein
MSKFKSWFNSINNKIISKPVVILIGGTATAQVLSFIFSPITTRLFSPEVFGELSVFNSITGIIGIIICLRFELSIVLPKDDSEALSLYKLSIKIALVISTITGIFLVLFGKSLFFSLGANELYRYWLFIPLVLLTTGIILPSNYWMTRTGNFKQLATNKIVIVLVSNIVTISLGVFGNVELGARLYSLLIANVIAVFMLQSTIYKKSGSMLSVAKIKGIDLIKKYRNFYIFDIWSALINNLSWMIVPILMNVYYSSAVAGQYSIGLRVIQLPASIIGSSITQVFIRTASEKSRNNTLYPYSLVMLKRLIMLAIIPSLILGLFSKQLFSMVFGNNWTEAGLYVQILAPWAFVWFISSPISSIFIVLQKQNLSLITSSINLITRIVSLYVGGLYQNPLLGLALFSISGFMVNFLTIILCMVSAKIGDNKKDLVAFGSLS